MLVPRIAGIEREPCANPRGMTPRRVTDARDDSRASRRDPAAWLRARDPPLGRRPVERPPERLPPPDDVEPEALIQPERPGRVRRVDAQPRLVHAPLAQ